MTDLPDDYPTDPPAYPPPSVGRIVHYREADGAVSAALVIGCDDPDPYVVDLLVHALGRDYREFGVPHDPDAPGSWFWPLRKVAS